ncbi:uncharacterized protein CC84DRAFT_795853 [Paraphaeosphaeria sporulosa]|uniref:F-box domain-containing protein n=1 Tax=Paraphaeosphaeria sporulosa TaxID=1460663 RepID=A0A177CCX1_9PLEO|nr:uncharacterized protein CC84DRAFT_795853 [Paraphaeosphaeria sporulosa]OAG04560.1 hypothetical protein CC84DRAFT_795853 [Paraphaeosphaeria sporulosa]
MAASPSSGLLRLPDELLLDILTHIDGLAHPWRTSSLYALSMASRRLHGITKPYLYSTFSFYTGVPYKFLRTLCLNSALASQVKVIRWDYDTSESERFRYEPGKLGVKQQWHIDDAHHKLQHMAAQGNSTASNLINHLRLGPLYLGDQRALEILLMFTPNLEHLEVVETYRWDDHVFWFLPILSRHDDFSRLTSATIQGPMRAPNVLLLMFLPTMRRLELSQVIEMRQEIGRTLQWDESWGSFILGPGSKDPPSSSLEHLHMLDSYADLDDVTQLVGLVRNLKSFVYEHARNELSIHYLDVPYQNIAQILKCQHITLTSLRIANTHILSPLYMPSADLIPLGEKDLFETIQDLPNLTCLEIFLSLAPSHRHRAFRWENLPPSLETLMVDHHSAYHYVEDRMDTSDLELSLADLAMRKRRGELPNLRMLVFRNWHPFYGTFPQDMSVKKVLEDVGIKFNSLPAKIGSSVATMYDIGWVELQTEPEWVIIETYNLNEE